MTYKIEALGEGGDWSEEYVGNDAEANTFDTETETEAEDMLPELARIFECESETIPLGATDPHFPLRISIRSSSVIVDNGLVQGHASA